MSDTQKPVGTLLSDIEPEQVFWVWDNWIPLKCITFFVGMPNAGKSTVVADIAARVTRDDVMPDGTPCGAPGGVVLIGLEEMVPEVVVPRMIAAGARRDLIVDLSKVERAVRPGSAVVDRFDMTQDLGLLHKAIQRVNASLVIIDPFYAAVSAKTHLWANQQASDVFMALQQFAEEEGVALLIINHFTKHSRKGLSGVDLLECMLGGAALGQRTRSAIYMGSDESDPTRKVLTLIKHSMSGDIPQITLRHNGRTVEYLTGVTPEQEELNEARNASTSRQRVLEILKAEPTRAFPPNVLGQMCGVRFDTMRQVLKRMVDDKQIARVDRGFYQARVTTSRKRP